MPTKKTISTKTSPKKKGSVKSTNTKKDILVDKKGEKQAFITQKGLDALKQELKRLENEERHKVAARLKEAISYGDLSENSEYDEAKNQQAFLESRILELTDQIKNSKVAESGNDDVVFIGSKVTIQKIGTKDTLEYKIVGSTEVDVFSHKISNNCPVGEALVGQKKGTTVTVNAPLGKIDYKILEIV